MQNSTTGACACPATTFYEYSYPTNSLNYCCPLNAIYNGTICGCSSKSTFIDQNSKYWYCETACPSNSVRVGSTAGFNTESCECNYGFVATITNTTASCACSIPYTLTAASTSPNNTLSVCCPPNSVVLGTNKCECDFNNGYY